MLTKEKEIELEIFEICKNSGDVNVGDRFDGVMYNSEFGDRPCVCIGKTNNTRLFVTEDKRCYFTVSGGWGVKDGKLASVDISGRLRFEKPAGADEIRSYIKNLKPATSCSSAARRHGYKTAAEMYLEAMDKFSSFKKYPLIIPKKGEKLTARLLFTPTSGQVIQYLEKEDLIEINNAINNIELKEFIELSKTNQFGICLAQFISTSKTLESQNVSYGDTVLLLFPFQVCKRISRMIEKYCKMPLGMDKMFCHPDTGFCICFDVSEDGKYSVKEIKSVIIETSLTDDEFMQFVDTLELYKPELYE